MRAEGLDYSEISNLGGGIRKTVSQTRMQQETNYQIYLFKDSRSAKTLSTGRMNANLDMVWMSRMRSGHWRLWD